MNSMVKSIVACCTAAATAAFVVVLVAPAAQTEATPYVAAFTNGQTSLSTSQGVAPSLGPIPKITQESGIKLASDAWIEAPSKRARVLSAEHALLQKCISSYGLSDTVPEWAGDSTAADQHGRLFGLVDLGSAMKYGYHTAEESQGAGMGEALSTSSNSDSFTAVYMGDPSNAVVGGKQVPAGGCAGQARKALDDLTSPQDVVDELVNYGLTMSDRDARVHAAFARWSACMAARGFSYATPMDAINDPRWGSQAPSTGEIQVATADVQCKTATNLTGLRVAVASAYQDAYLKAHPTLTTSLSRQIASQLNLANSVKQ